MRSTIFVIFSVVLHMACVMALVMVPEKTQPDLQPIEVAMGSDGQGEGGDGNEGAPSAEQIPSPAPSPAVVAEPAPKVEPSAPAKAKPVAVKKPVLAKKPAKVIAAKPIGETDPNKENKATEELIENELTEELDTEQADAKPTPIKETAPVGIEAEPSDKYTEAMSEDVERAKKIEPAATATAAVAAQKEPQDQGSKVASVAPVSTAASPTGSGEESARSYLDLRQMNGNQPPQYPLEARRQKRQGQVDLVYRVTKEGYVKDIQIVRSSGSSDLDAEAVRAISKYKFVPGQEGWAKHPVIFTLKGQPELLPSKLRSSNAQID